MGLFVQPLNNVVIGELELEEDSFPWRYRFRLGDTPKAGQVEIARAEVSQTAVTIALHQDIPQAFEVMDFMMAAMPTQIIRGDGLRDSHLQILEETQDWLRFLETPSIDRLSDVLTAADIVTTPEKIQRVMRDHISEKFNVTLKPGVAAPTVACRLFGCEVVAPE